MSDDDDEDEPTPGSGSADVLDLEDIGKVMHMAAVSTFSLARNFYTGHPF